MVRIFLKEIDVKYKEERKHYWYWFLNYKIYVQMPLINYVYEDKQRK